MSALEEASDRLRHAVLRMTNLHVRWRAVNEEVNRAEAEVFRLSILDAIDKDEATTWGGDKIDLHALVGFSYEVTAEYDDEGRYPLCVSISWEWAEGVDESKIDPWDVVEERPSPEVAAVLCEGDEDDWEGHTTIARLREISFA